MSFNISLGADTQHQIEALKLKLLTTLHTHNRGA